MAMATIAPSATPSAFDDEPESLSGPLEYDPAIASDGLTLDTALGPVDLVAVDRAMRGFETPLTLAERVWVTRLRRRSSVDC